ncbi:hypothetical protein KEM54_005719 [Ascosphaera aggregata]|nr:hypothetical protein KEM54_005719 [Ascosphaera aggregata]
MAESAASGVSSASATAAAEHIQPAGTKIPAKKAPMPLSAFQESEVQKVYHKRVRDQCAEEIKAFAECAMNRTVTATWICRDKRLAMNSCMLSHASREEEDRAREQWFAEKEEKRRQRELEQMGVEKRRAEVIRLMREDEAQRARAKENEQRSKPSWFSWGRN